ncbi:hypothetical protein GTP38_16075 [Duganella sp. FT94W]|uniref:Sel1 repeat family protein n=1 Tax=Duganella lactea TaxID=2692173 RepID=A0ABW9V8Z5_9BURK|nr:SEL1-like repeat protein [Duganella lactea]MYM35853.1 hypothetical protein [Duganella lactea]
MNLLRPRGLATLLINIAWLAPSHAGVRETADINRILRSVSDGRCEEAIQYLAERLQSKQPELQLLAGSMYDQGSCVERNWEKATQLYQQAALGGMGDDALPRLVSIYAVGYRDPAAALWWAAQRPAMLPKDCLPAADPTKQASAFLDELRGWPESRLKGCTYYAGVLFRLKYRSSVRLIRRGASDEVPVNIKIDAANGLIEWYSVIDMKTVVSHLPPDSREIDMSTAPSEDEDPFLRYLWATGVIVLKEFGAPPAQIPSWDTKNTIHIARAIYSPNMLEFITVSP